MCIRQEDYINACKSEALLAIEEDLHILDRGTPIVLEVGIYYLFMNLVVLGSYYLTDAYWWNSNSLHGSELMS